MLRAQRLLLAYILSELEKPRIIQQITQPYRGGGGPHTHPSTDITGVHASTHEIDGTDLVRPYYPVSGVWQISGVASPFVLKADNVDYMFFEGVGYFNPDTGKLKVTA